jgi:hypothetical protein
MKPPIHDVPECTPPAESCVRICLEDGTPTTAIFSAHWWDDARARSINPVRRQSRKNPWDGTLSKEKQPELGLRLEA